LAFNKVEEMIYNDWFIDYYIILRGNYHGRVLKHNKKNKNMIK